jgi:hypothetical protein
MSNIKPHLISFNRESMVYSGFFYVQDDIITTLIYNIYNIDELTMNPSNEYRFIDNIMYIRSKDSSSTWKPQHMDFFTIKELVGDVTNDEVLIYDETEKVKIKAYLTVNKYTKMIVNFILEYIDIDCLYGKDNIYKFISDNIYIKTNNDWVLTNWEYVFDIVDCKIDNLWVTNLLTDISSSKIEIQNKELNKEPIPNKELNKELIPNNLITDKSKIMQQRVNRQPLSNGQHKHLGKLYSHIQR